MNDPRVVILGLLQNARLMPSLSKLQKQKKGCLWDNQYSITFF